LQSDNPETSGRHLYQRIGFLLGPLLALLVLFSPTPEGLSPEGWKVVALAAWMAVWWSTEAIPVPATSLIPLVYLPLAGVGSLSEASSPYANPVIFLLLGGFIIAMAMQRWHLHQRIALAIVTRAGDHPAALIGGFMAASAFLSMWISNTATTLMMVPIALGVAEAVAGEDEPHPAFTVALLLGVAYAASIGGLGTIVGTPPNLLVVGYLRETMGIEISFVQWMAFGVPVVLLMVPIAWFVLTRWAFRIDSAGSGSGGQVVRDELAAMGRITLPERRTALLFLAVAAAWICRPLIVQIPGLEGLSDMGIAVAGAVAVFVIPSGSTREKGSFLLDWDWAVRLPWGVILLFGGGLSLAAAVAHTGLAVWLGDALAVLTTFHLLILMLALVSMVIFLTELTSNTATVAALLPVLGAVALKGNYDPILLAAPAALAASCAFMLPVATAPNAIIFSGGHVTIPHMVKAGFRLNLLGIVIVTGISYGLVPVIFRAFG
jgi:sodium-dependent dicarboxylate transporter 2/3/5